MDKKSSKSSEKRTNCQSESVKVKRKTICEQDFKKELVDVEAPNIFNAFKNNILKACNEVCGKERKNHVDRRWWLNEGVKKALRHKRVAY